MVLFAKFDKLRLVFGVWFVLNCLEFIEYFLTYNKAVVFVHWNGNEIGVNMTNIKYLVLTFLTMFKIIKWKSQSYG